VISREIDNLASWLELRVERAVPLPFGCVLMPTTIGSLQLLADRLRVLAEDARAWEEAGAAAAAEAPAYGGNVVPLRRRRTSCSRDDGDAA
jgi:hypothetical protein